MIYLVMDRTQLQGDFKRVWQDEKEDEIMRKILITNDDGINADGIVRLAKAATEFGEVWVVAPDSQRSAMSHSVTLRHSVEAWKVDFPVPGVQCICM